MAKALKYFLIATAACMLFGLLGELLSDGDSPDTTNQDTAAKPSTGPPEQQQAQPIQPVAAEAAAAKAPTGGLLLAGQEEQFSARLNEVMAKKFAKFEEKAKFVLEPVDSSGRLAGHLEMVQAPGDYKFVESITRRAVMEAIKLLIDDGINPNSKHDDIIISIRAQKGEKSITGEDQIRLYGRSVYQPDTDDIIFKKAGD